MSLNSKTRTPLFLTVAGIALMAAHAASAQAPQSPPAGASVPTAGGDGPLATAQNAAPPGEGLHMSEVVVTGASAATQKFKAPYAITVLSGEQIQDKAPTSTTDVLKGTPGLWVESTGGEGGGENVYARGLPGGSYEFFGLEEDGLPLFEVTYESFANIDEVERVDLGTVRAEIVRGGTGPIYDNNANGGLVNFITNHGTASQQGAFKFTTGANGLLRGDLTESGPVADNLLMSVSGFIRTDNGLRNPGYSNGDLGGQIKVGATYLLPKGKIWGDVKFLDDKDVYYTDIPLTNPVTGASLGNLINPSYGTLDSPAFEHVNLRNLTPGGGVASNSRDLTDGLHSTVETVTLGGDYDLGAGVTFSDKARYTRGLIVDNAIFNGTFVTGGADGFSAQAYANGLVKPVPGAVSARYVLAGTNTAVSPAEDLVLNNTWDSIHTEYSDFINDARFDGKIDDPTFGRHDVAVGLYYSHYTYTQQRLVGTFLSDVKNQPDLLDVQALNAAGSPIGNVTSDGFTSYGNGASGRVTGDAVSVYASEDWRLTQAWRIDLGLRHETAWQNGEQGVITSQNVNLPGVVVPISVSGATSFVPHSETLNGTAWTVGSSYQLAQPVNIFLRYTNSYSFPRTQNVWAGANFNGKPLPVTTVDQAEGGVKLNWPGLSIFAVGFYSHFHPLITSLLVENTAGQLVNQNISAETTDAGAEIETSWAPTPWFDVLADLTAQHTEVNNVISPGFDTSGTDGKWEPRVPDILASLQPTYHFAYQGVKGRVFATWSYIGERFEDYNNLSRLPAYQTVDAGATFDVRNLTFGAHVLNLTNSTGLTEGNARLSGFALTPSTPVADASIGRPIYGRTFTIDVTVHW